MAKPLTPIADVEKALLAAATPISDSETLPLLDALQRVLIQDIQSTIAVPAFDNSAMDGYAVRVSDLVKANNEPNEKIALPESQRILAGAASPEPLAPNTCARIFTGAIIPEGADAVVMQEHCEQGEGDGIHVPVSVALGNNIRRRGQDIERGALVLASGTRLRPQELGLLASVGIAEVTVRKRLRVAIFSTGDEVVEPGQDLGSGQIYNSNRYTLSGLLRAWGIEVVDLGVVKDNFETTRETLISAAEQADCIITTGGVSVGEADFIKDAVAALGKLDLWRIAIKPGKPFAFGSVGDTPFIGLPGNPAAVFVTLLILVKPFLRALLGLDQKTPVTESVVANFSCSKPLIREQFLFVKTEVQNGIKVLNQFPNQSSGILRSSAWASGLARVPVDTTIEQGDTIRYYDYSQLMEW